jgi:hypothetical protein
MQGKSEGPRSVGNIPIPSSLDGRPPSTLLRAGLPGEPIKPRGRLNEVGKERDRTRAKRSGSSGRDRWWPKPGVCVKNSAFAAIRFWLGWNCQLLDEGGVLHWRTKAPHVDAGPNLVAATSGEKAGDFQRAAQYCAAIIMHGIFHFAQPRFWAENEGWPPAMSSKTPDPLEFSPTP